MKFSTFVLTTIVSSLFFVSCTKEDNQSGGTPLGNYDNGVLILNQGGFGHGDASISYVSDDFSTQQNNIFSLVNPTITLGDTAQDIGFYQNLAFIVLNNSNKIEVVNRYTMAHVATISSGLSNPRYIAFSSGKGFVTNWGDGTNTSDDYVAVLNLLNYTVSSTIPVAEGPERIVENDNKLYVAHAGGYNFGNTISVINATNNSVNSTITVGDVPNSLKVNNGTLYVLCGGKPNYASTPTAGSLVKINLATNTVATTQDFPASIHPSNFNIDGINLFYNVDSVIYKSPLSATSLPTIPLFTSAAQSVYSFAVVNDNIYVGDAVDYNSNGKVYVYSSAGVLEHDYNVGIIPAGFYFN